MERGSPLLRCVAVDGLGLAERRYGAFLHKQERNSYLISTKVGKLLKAAPRNNSKELFPYANSPNNVVFDYTADGVKRSLEDSLQRLGIDHIDIVFVHDISSDNVLLPKPWPEEFAVALKGAFPALSQMRDEGVIKAWGIGVNTPEPIVRVMQESDPDVCLLASQYSLIDHANALNNVFPVARQRDVSFVVGSSLNAGFIQAVLATIMARTIGTFHRNVLPSATSCARWPTSSAWISEPQHCNSPQRPMSRFR